MRRWHLPPAELDRLNLWIACGVSKQAIWRGLRRLGYAPPAPSTLGKLLDEHAENYRLGPRSLLDHGR